MKRVSRVDAESRALAREVREALAGPVTSVNVIFDRDGGIDFTGIRQHIDFVLAAGSKALILTYGDSLYSLLSDGEVGEVTRVTLEQAAGRALVVAADRMWATPQAVAFARFARDLGAGLVMPLPPAWAGSCTPQSLVEHYAAIAAEMPVMLVTMALAVYPAATRLEIIEAVRDRVQDVVAVKDDLGGEFARRLSMAVYDRWAVISGGLKENHLSHAPYGCDGYFSTFMKFKPEIARVYWGAVQSGDWGRAGEIVGKMEMPWFKFIQALPGGFDAGIHGTLELYGICRRWRRKPYHSLTDEEMDRLGDFYRQRGWL